MSHFVLYQYENNPKRGRNSLTSASVRFRVMHIDMFFGAESQLFSLTKNDTLTKSQSELAEKFVTAFYDAQNWQEESTFSTCKRESHAIDPAHKNLFDDLTCYDDPSENYDNDFIYPPESSRSLEGSSNQFFHDASHEFVNLTDFEFPSRLDSDTLREPCSDTMSRSEDLLNNSTSSEDYDDLDNIDLSDFDLSDNFSKSSFDVNSLSFNWDEYLDENNQLSQDHLTRSDPDFSQFIHHANPSSLIDSVAQNHNSHQKHVEVDFSGDMGHLIGTPNNQNNIDEDKCTQLYDDHNLAILFQNEVLLRDDPLLNSESSLSHNSQSFLEGRHHINSSMDQNGHADYDFKNSFRQMQCKWKECYQIYNSQEDLVRHIEKMHVEIKKGDEFTCHWNECPRKSKPFNARYKLLIHMRVHSGEKPNKCPFTSCNKAFSRLENLKIHQRSHTGERPYLCQIGNCPKSFSNSSDRAKHQRTHFDTKPYACQITGCSKKYTDPSSLRKHVKNHSYDEQMQLKKKNDLVGYCTTFKNGFDKDRIPNAEEQESNSLNFSARLDHSYTRSGNLPEVVSYVSENRMSFVAGSVTIKQNLKNKITAKRRCQKSEYFFNLS